MQENNQVSNTAVRSSIVKDLSIPISIVVAGLFIGAGLYFGGGSQPAPLVAQENAPRAAEQPPAGNTDQVNAVTAEDHIKGSLEAPIKIVEYSDFDCPFCTRFHETMNGVTETYSGDEVAWVYRHFPLEQLHPQAPAVAVASECVAEIGGEDAFWAFADGYYAARGAGDRTAHSELISDLAIDAGVSQQALTECLDSGRHEAAVQADMEDAVETGGRGTPWSILIGPSGKTYPINGALPQQAIEQLIETAQQEA